MLSQFLVIIYILLFYVVSFPVGYLFLHVYITGKKTSFSTIIITPIILAVGLLALSFFLSVTAFYVINRIK